MLFFKAKYTVVQSISSYICYMQAFLFDLFISIFKIYFLIILKNTKTKFGDKDELETNTSHQTVVFSFFLLN